MSSVSLDARHHMAHVSYWHVWRLREMRYRRVWWNDTQWHMSSVSLDVCHVLSHNTCELLRVIIWHMWAIDMCGSYVRWGIDVCDGMTLNNTCRVCHSMCVITWHMWAIDMRHRMAHVSYWHVLLNDTREVSTCVTHVIVACDCQQTIMSQHVTITWLLIDNHVTTCHNHIVDRSQSHCR